MIWTSNIVHPARKNLGISMNEYALADLIYHLSNNRKHRIKNWCTASKAQMAETFDISRRSVISIIQKLEDKKIVQRHKNGQFLRTTNLWYDSVIMYKPGCEESSQLASQGVKKVHSRCEESSQPSVKKVHSKCEESSHNSNNINIDINSDIEREEEKNTHSPKESPNPLNASQGIDTAGGPAAGVGSEPEEFDATMYIIKAIRKTSREKMDAWKMQFAWLRSMQGKDYSVMLFEFAEYYIKYLQLPDNRLRQRIEGHNKTIQSAFYSMWLKNHERVGKTSNGKPVSSKVYERPQKITQ